MKELLIDTLSSPIGNILIVADGEQMCSLDFEDYEERMMKLLKRRYGLIQLKRVEDPHGFSSRVADYFNGSLNSLDSIPVATGGTPFQQKVWSSLREIPVGQKITYGCLAEKIGRPRAARAVGMANSLNPIAIVLPCHRVVGSDDSLTGYAGGLDRKQWLLRHEQKAAHKWF
jgi:methylated-DNA-[protein]-cysteine S-methyltransferase